MPCATQPSPVPDELRNRASRLVQIASASKDTRKLKAGILAAQRRLALDALGPLAEAAAARDIPGMIAAGKALDAAVGEQLADEILSLGDTILSRVYLNGTAAIVGNRSWRMNRTDKRAIAWLQRDFTYWVGQHWGSDLSAKITETLTPAIDQGLSRAKMARLLSQTVGAELRRSADYWDGLANHVTTRSRNFGCTEGLVRAGATNYQIKAVMDERTSTVCRSMHDRIFTVNQALFLRDQLLAAKDPEQVKAIAPWRNLEEIEGLKTEELPPGMELPPYHWKCRTTMVIWFEKALRRAA